MRSYCLLRTLFMCALLLGKLAFWTTYCCGDDDGKRAKPTLLSGHVIDVGKKDAANAIVDIRFHRQDFSVGYYRARADASGRFSAEFEGDSSGFRQWKIVATNSQGDQAGFFRFDQSQTANSEIDIQLEPTKSALVQVVDAEAKPVKDANVILQFGYPHSTNVLSTDADGKAMIEVPESERVTKVLGWKDGVGFDYRAYNLGRYQRADLNADMPEFPKGGAKLQLEGATPISVTVVDDAGAPIKGVSLFPWLVRKDSENDELNLSFFLDSFSQVTDANGKTTFSWIPTWQSKGVTFWPTSEGYSGTRAIYSPAKDEGRLTISLTPLVSIRGRVLDETGEPAVGIVVKAKGEGYNWDGGQDETESASDGSFELNVPPEQIYMVTVDDKNWVADAVPGFAINKGKLVEGVELKLRKPTRLTGHLKEDSSGNPLPDERVIVYQYGDDLDSIVGAKIANPENSLRYVRPVIVKVSHTDANGKFEFLLGDGSYDIRPPRQEKAEKFEIDGEETLSIDVTTAIQKKVKLTGVALDNKDKSKLANVRVFGVSQRFSGDDWEARTGKDGVFAVERLKEPAYVHAVTEDKSLSTIATLAADQKSIELALKKTGSAHGILLQTNSDEPAVKTKVRYGVRVPDENNQSWSNRFGGAAMTDSEGRFELKGLVPEWEYELDLESRPDGTIPNLKSVAVDPGQTVDMGKLSIPAPPKPYVPPTLDDRITRAFAVKGSPTERFQLAIPRCKLLKQKLVIVLGAADNRLLRSFMKLRYEDKDFREIRDDFRFMALSTKEEKQAADATTLLDRIAATSSKQSLGFSLVVTDENGSLIDQESDGFLDDGKLSKQAVLDWLRSHIGTRIDAREMLDKAFAQAKKENKRLFVQETATWCGPCHMLSKFLNDHREWEADYIWVKMDHRYTGAREIMKELRDGASGGIPWYAILDAEGERLATSNHSESGDNMGYPSSDKGREHFKSMLLETRLSMTADDIDQFVAHLQD